MAAVQVAMAGPIHTLPDWKRDDTRNITRSAKAERILGVYEDTTTIAATSKRRLGPLNFLSELRDVLPGLHRKASRPRFHVKVSDSESVESTHSPTFDPASSNTSLNTTGSSPVIERKEPDLLHNDSVDTLSQADTLRVRKVYMPTKKDNDRFKLLQPLDLPPLTIDLGESIAAHRRKRSVTSLGSYGSDTTMKAQGTSRVLKRRASRELGMTRSVQPLRSNVGEAEQHVQEWLETAQLDRRPSMMTRLSSLPVNTAMSSSGESIITLTSEVKSDKQTGDTQWPLPSTALPPPRKLRRIHKSDLKLESVLSLSSDEDSDTETSHKRSISSVERRSRPASTIAPRASPTHQRKESTTSSVIQLDSRPWIRPLPAIPKAYPKRSLADIAAVGAGRDSGESWEDDVVEPEQVPTPELEEIEDFLASPTDSAVTPTHPLWRSSSGSFDIDIRISRPTFTLQPLPEEPTPEQERSNPMDITHEIIEDEADEVDVSDFPVPPRSRAGSVVPSIHIQHTDGSRRLLRASLSDNPNHDIVLLSPSTLSRSGSIISDLSSNSSQSSHGGHFDDGAPGIRSRKRTISNVPIILTGLESSVMDCGGDDGDVSSYIYSSIF